MERRKKIDGMKKEDGRKKGHRLKEDGGIEGRKKMDRKLERKIKERDRWQKNEDGKKKEERR